ncbi:hypothetical protein HWV62_21002 [Athelia sp. TMB]|nr:hypothetical protein HWV62_21002 [Athelia sp. TMB]
MLPSLLQFLIASLFVQLASSLVVNASSPLTAPVVSSLSVAVNTTANSTRACDDIHTCRTLYSIVQTCLATIFACVWVAVHRNISGPKTRIIHSSNPIISVAQSLWAKMLDQKQSLVVFLVTLLAPEWVLAWAIRQAIRARQLARELEAARAEAAELWAMSHAERVSEGGSPAAEEQDNRIADISLQSPPDDQIPLIETRIASSSTSTAHVAPPENHIEWTRAKRVAQLDQAWTVAHAFFIIMGGYHGYNEHGPLYPLDPKTVVSLIKDGKLVPPTTDELADRSKGDFLSKGVAILQTFWFVVQCIARLAEHLPITNLEVMTLAYTIMTLAMYVAWWNKPLSINCAIRVPTASKEANASRKSVIDIVGDYVLGSQDISVDLGSLRRVPTFWAGKPDESDVVNADIFALAVAVAFGAVHCIAWSYAFASHKELLMWRVSTMTVVVVPAGLFISLLLTRAKISVVESLYAPILSAFN